MHAAWAEGRIAPAAWLAHVMPSPESDQHHVILLAPLMQGCRSTCTARHTTRHLSTSTRAAAASAWCGPRSSTTCCRTRSAAASPRCGGTLVRRAPCPARCPSVCAGAFVEAVPSSCHRNAECAPLSLVHALAHQREGRTSLRWPRVLLQGRERLCSTVHRLAGASPAWSRECGTLNQCTAMARSPNPVLACTEVGVGQGHKSGRRSGQVTGLRSSAAVLSMPGLADTCRWSCPPCCRAPWPAKTI